MKQTFNKCAAAQQGSTGKGKGFPLGVPCADGLWTSLAALRADWRLDHRLTASPHLHPLLDEKTQKGKKTKDKTVYDSCARPGAFNLFALAHPQCVPQKLAPEGAADCAFDFVTDLCTK